MDQATQAAASLQLLLKEDPLLEQHGLTITASHPDKVAFPYAASLLQDGDEEDDDDADDDDDNNNGDTNKQRSGIGIGGRSLRTQQRADLALQDVERKLALVESLAVKLSRTSPEAIAGHLLRLHGYQLLQQPQQENNNNNDTTNQLEQQASSSTMTTTTTTLSAIRDRADRLERQADMLENVAQRVETSLTRNLHRMETSCTRLERVLTLSSTLKMILRLQFENSKLQNYDLDDLRDLTRAAASVAVVEDLLSAPELRGSGAGISVVERMRPQAEGTGRAVRQAAAKLLQELYGQPTALQQLGATLQVYYHLGELPDAVWKAVDHAHNQAQAVSRQLFNAVTLSNMNDQAKKAAKETRMIQKKLKEERGHAAQEWANGIVDVATQVRSLHRVLTRKSDPQRRQLYVDVVAAASIPTDYARTAAHGGSSNKGFSLFTLFWGRLAASISRIIENILEQDPKLTPDVAALYPAVRVAALELTGRLHDSAFAGSTSTSAAAAVSVLDDAGATPMSAGILGGSNILEDAFLGWSTTPGSDQGIADNPQSAASATMWSLPPDSAAIANQQAGSSSASTASSFAGVFHSQEWITLQGNEKTKGGLYLLQRAFLDACTERLLEPLQYMFPENALANEAVASIDDGVPLAPVLLPSKYDVQRFDENIRQELSLSDPREGGGDLSAVTMIAECVVGVISQFCSRAGNAIRGPGKNGYITSDWRPTESLEHDRRVMAIVYSLANYLRSAPEKTFVAPYRPATLPQHEEAAKMCQIALAPALQEINTMIKNNVLTPLCRALDRRIANVVARVHLGVYMESGGGGGLDDGSSPAFVQKHLSPVFETIAENHLARFPPAYASVIASTVATYTICALISNLALVRPLGEAARLQITQDLADFELTLEQFVAKGGGSGGSSVSLNVIDGGRPYAELRAMRQLLFWAGLEDTSKTSHDVARSLLRETFLKDLRPSTVCHYLFSYAPTLLSSPHHAKRMSAEDYVSTLITLDGSTESGEDSAWMMTMKCADTYKERATTTGHNTTNDGDSRVADIVLTVGQELLRRRRH